MGNLEGILKVDIGDLWNGELAISLAEKFLKAVSDLTEVKAAVVIGSRAKGEWDRSSDLDLLIVSKSDIRSALPKLEGFGVVDPKPYTEGDLVRGIFEAEVEVIEAFENGKILLDDGTWNKAKNFYEKVRKILKIRKYKQGWKIEKRIPREELEKLCSATSDGSHSQERKSETLFRKLVPYRY
jgi:predicted nucleotidyltransferase